MRHRLARDVAVIDPNVESGHCPVRVARQRSPLAHQLVDCVLQRLLIKFGSVERVVTADEESLTQVRGIGLRKAARIRELVGG